MICKNGCNECDGCMECITEDEEMYICPECGCEMESDDYYEYGICPYCQEDNESE